MVGEINFVFGGKVDHPESRLAAIKEEMTSRSFERGSFSLDDLDQRLQKAIAHVEADKEMYDLTDRIQASWQHASLAIRSDNRDEFEKQKRRSVAGLNELARLASTAKPRR